MGEPHCSLPEVVRTVPQVAFVGANLNDGAPTELLELHAPNGIRI